MKKAVNQIEETIRDGSKEINEKLDSMTQILGNLIDQISSYQELVQNQI